MYAQKENPKENKSRAVANSVAQKKSTVKQGFGFVDNRQNYFSSKKLMQFVRNGDVTKNEKDNPEKKEDPKKFYTDAGSGPYDKKMWARQQEIKEASKSEKLQVTCTSCSIAVNKSKMLGNIRFFLNNEGVDAGVNVHYYNVKPRYVSDPWLKGQEGSGSSFHLELEWAKNYAAEIAPTMEEIVQFANGKKADTVFCFASIDEMKSTLSSAPIPATVATSSSLSSPKEGAGDSSSNPDNDK